MGINLLRRLLRFIHLSYVSRDLVQAVIRAHDASKKRPPRYTRLGEIRIGHRVFIGAWAIVLLGASIGDDVIIGIGGDVSRNVPSGVAAAEKPARPIRSLDKNSAAKSVGMKSAPCFGVVYTLRGNITADMESGMRFQIENSIGYVG